MSAMTEAPFSLTIKVGPNSALLTGRAGTRDEMIQRVLDLQVLKAEIEGSVPAPAEPAPVPTTEQAVQNVVAAMPGSEVTGSYAPAIEQRDDKWGNKYTSGMPDAGTCQHGPRVVKNGTSKAGRPYKAYVCMNDSPFGDYRQGKCDATWPPR